MSGTWREFILNIENWIDGSLYWIELNWKVRGKQRKARNKLGRVSCNHDGQSQVVSSAQQGVDMIEASGGEYAMPRSSGQSAFILMDSEGGQQSPLRHRGASIANFQHHHDANAPLCSLRTQARAECRTCMQCCGIISFVSTGIGAFSFLKETTICTVYLRKTWHTYSGSWWTKHENFRSYNTTGRW